MLVLCKMKKLNLQTYSIRGQAPMQTPSAHLSIWRSCISIDIYLNTIFLYPKSTNYKSLITILNIIVHRGVVYATVDSDARHVRRFRPIAWAHCSWWQYDNSMFLCGWLVTRVVRYSSSVWQKRRRMTADGWRCANTQDDRLKEKRTFIDDRV